MKNRLTYTDTAKQLHRVLAMTGLKSEKFTALVQHCETLWQRRMQRITLENTPRNRAYKPRKNSVLETTENRLLFVLSSMKLNL
ncbi:MAG: hypothetical protein EAZ92_09460 [Candidatus Kapaibacterium sp.]|nr:MAG: hypothetical protein EAZ92_09460 [Candidatus Kapabacteria bacterium]